VQQTAAKERERRILQLTIDEIKQIEGDVNMYKGVGKMYVVADLSFAFLSSPTQVHDGSP
jgi:chaperonin cofactor prefoldin